MLHPGEMIITGYCQCNITILEFAGDFFIEGLVETGKLLEKVVCPLLKALDIVMAVAMAAIPPPGKAITGGMGQFRYSQTRCTKAKAEQWPPFDQQKPTSMRMRHKTRRKNGQTLSSAGWISLDRLDVVRSFPVKMISSRRHSIPSAML
jgi:hypothetical protein